MTLPDSGPVAQWYVEGSCPLSMSTTGSPRLSRSLASFTAGRSGHVGMAAGDLPRYAAAPIAIPIPRMESANNTLCRLGAIARPKNVWVVADMPKTRSGKIMRRVIASVSNFADIGDVTTLANPEVVETIRHHVQSAKVAKGELPRELSEAEYEEIAKYGAAE